MLEFAKKSTIKTNSVENALALKGDLTDEELGEVCVAVKEVVKNHNSLDINLNKVGYGPDEKIPPRFIWASGEKSKELFCPHDA